MLTRTHIDLEGCQEAQLRAVSSLLGLANEILKREKLRIRLPLQAVASRGFPEQHSFIAILDPGYFYMLTVPALGHVAVDVSSEQPHLGCVSSMLREGLQAQTLKIEEYACGFEATEMFSSSLAEPVKSP